MPPRAKISDQQWSMLEPIIRDLFQRRVPLKCKSGSRKTIPEILQQDHGLTITISQLEAKLREWNVAKKLRLSEWKLVMPRLNDLESKGIEYQLLLAGQEINKTAIQRARRTLGGKTPADEPCIPSALEAANEPQARQVSIMVRGDGDLWIPYENAESERSREASPTPTLGQAPGLVPEGLEMPEPDIDALDCDSPLALVQTARAPYTPHSGTLDSHAFDQHHFSSPNMQELYTSDAFGVLVSAELADNSFGFDPTTFHGTLPDMNLLSPGVGFLNLSAPTAWHGNPDVGVNIPTNPPSPLYGEAADIPRRAPMHPQNLLHIILEHAAQPEIARPRNLLLHPLPTTQELMDRLLSLLPGKEDEQIICRAAAPDPATVRLVLLNSVVNNFAGMQDIPISSVLAVLRRDAHMRSELFEHLCGSSPALAKTVADNLFRAAVEARDVEAAKLLITAGTGKPYAIRPDDIVCRLEHGTFTPLELATSHRNREMVFALLHCGANPNLSRYIWPRGIKGNGALEHSIRIRRHEAADTQIIEALVNHGAKVYSSFIESIAERPSPGVLPILLRQLPATAHRELCQRTANQPSPLVRIVEYQSSEDSITAVRLLLGLCGADRCGTCTADFSDEFTQAFVHAAMHGSLELCQLFAYHKIKPNALALSAAIRSCRNDIISFIFEQGVGFDEPPSALQEYTYGLDRYSTSEHALTSPLAEAIRVRNHPLAKSLEALGAWRMLQESANHFEAAAIAAAEVNDTEYLSRILANGPDFPANLLALPLSGAICGGNTQAAMMLLNAGAKTHTSVPHGALFPVSWLLEAMKQRNKDIVYALLESDCHITTSTMDRVMEQAALWGDLSLTKDLIHLGADVNAGYATNLLIEAVKSQDRDLIMFLLANKANPNARPRSSSSVSAFGVAINMADEELVDVFLSYGADPALDYLFEHGISNGPRLKLLLKAFTARYPRGLPGFGAAPLAHAIDKNMLEALDAFLAAGMDPKGFYEFWILHPSRFRCTMTPLGSAIQRCEGDLGAVRALIDAGADVNRMAAMYESLQSDQQMPGESALLVAIRVRKAAVVRFLLEKGADVNHEARLGVKRTPLQAACEIGSSCLVRLLLDWGAEVNAPPARRGGGTALQLAAKEGYVQIVELLLSLGADVHAKPSRTNGRSALEGAAEHGRLRMLSVLWAAQVAAGFPEDEIQRAIKYAEKGGHKGCADYIKWLWVTRAAGRGLSHESGGVLS